MNTLLEKIREVFAEWKNNYDLSYDIPFPFDLDGDGRICWNGRPLTPRLDAAPESAGFTADSIYFHLSEGRCIYIQMAWPEDDAPYVRSVLFGYVQ